MLLVAGCSADPGPVEARCAKAYPDATVVAAYETTVGVVRARTAGPGRRPAATAWPELRDEDAAAWCYVDGTGDHRIVAAVATGEPVVFARGNFEPQPQGPQLP